MPEIKINYIVYTKVHQVYQIAEDWHVHFEGSRESLNFGKEKPPYEVGEEIRITFEKVNHAKSV